MTPDDIDLIEVASTLLAGYALDIRMAHNVDHQAPDWKDEPDALAMHDQTKGAADALLDLAARMRTGPA